MDQALLAVCTQFQMIIELEKAAQLRLSKLREMEDVIKNREKIIEEKEKAIVNETTLTLLKTMEELKQIMTKKLEIIDEQERKMQRREEAVKKRERMFEYGQAIRLMLAYKEEAFEDKKYNYGPPPDYNRQEWMKEKPTLGLAFPNLPYYIDGDIKITQSVAIMRYLARKLKLDAETEEERLRTDMIEQQAIDFRTGLVMIVYKPEFEQLKGDYLKNLPSVLQSFANYLGKSDWFAGDKLTYVDFLIYEILDQHLQLDPECLKKFAALESFHARFKQLPTIEKYMSSPDFLSFPINGDSAYFASRRTQQK